MADFLITQVVMYPWLAWVLAVFTVTSLFFWFLLGLAGAKAWLDWGEMRREDRRILADILARAHADDPPEYQPDEEPEGLIWCDVCKAERPQDCICGEADENWVQDLGLPRWSLENLAEGLRAMGEAGAFDDDDLSAPVYLRGPAMPPQPVREYLHPAVMADIDEAGLSHHETNEGAVDSMFTRAMAREVTGMELGDGAESSPDR